MTDWFALIDDWKQSDAFKRLPQIGSKVRIVAVLNRAEKPAVGHVGTVVGHSMYPTVSVDLHGEVKVPWEGAAQTIFRATKWEVV